MMTYVVAVVLLLIVGVLTFFKMPYSKTKNEFSKLLDNAIENAIITDEVFTENDIKDLPKPLKKYFAYCGFIGMKKPSYMKIEYKNVNFNQDGTPLKMNYTHYNFVRKPERLAYIDSSKLGIPFDGIDKYYNGIGLTKGVLAKLFTLFEESGEEINRAGLVTCLAEGILLPSFILQDYVTWEEIDETHVKGILNANGLTVSGIFTFDEKGAWLSFSSFDRKTIRGDDGVARRLEWEGIAGDYKDVNGIKVPSTLQGVWHYPEEDLYYFNSDNLNIVYY